MRASWLAAGAAAVWFVVAGVAAQAAICQGGKTLWADSFDRLDPTWGDADNQFYVDNGVLDVIPHADQAYYGFNNSAYYLDADYCVDVLAIKVDLKGDSYAGAIFWGIDKENYFSFLITADGWAAVFRRQKSESQTLIDWQKFSAIKKGTGAVNRVGVVTRGSRATFYVNGTKFKSITGQPPDNGWLFGVRAASPKNWEATYGFDNVKVTTGQ